MRVSGDRVSQAEGQQCKGPGAGTYLRYLRTFGTGEWGKMGRVEVKEKLAQTGRLGAIVRTPTLTLNEVERVEGFDRGGL